MSAVLSLSNSYHHCPQCWQNFINMLIADRSEKNQHILGEDIPISVINRELQKYDAVYLEHEWRVPYLMFHDPKLMTKFILEWT